MPLEKLSLYFYLVEFIKHIKKTIFKWFLQPFLYSSFQKMGEGPFLHSLG